MRIIKLIILIIKKKTITYSFHIAQPTVENKVNIKTTPITQIGVVLFMIMNIFYKLRLYEGQSFL